MANLTEKHELADGLHIFKQSNSQRWYARFVVEGEWYTRTTKEKHKKQAIEKAYELRIQFRTKVENDIPIKRARRSSQHLFPQVADLAIARMAAEASAGAGKVAYCDYAGALNKYHKEFFKCDPIMEIDRQRLLDFDQWRNEKLGRIPAKSTILNHNAAMQRVFDEAVIRKYMVASQIPGLSNNGVLGAKAAVFTKEEFKALINAYDTWQPERKSEKTEQIRILLYYYVLFAVQTGMRPGTEIDNLTWDDIRRIEGSKERHTVVMVRKGKTTKHTGPRQVVCQPDVLPIFGRLKKQRPDAKKLDKIFVLPNGESSKQLSRQFAKWLEHAGLRESPFGDRTLYSLRHSYITWQLEARLNIHLLARHCGTSAQIINDFYDHISPERHADDIAALVPRGEYGDFQWDEIEPMLDVMPEVKAMADELLNRHNLKKRDD